MTKRDRLAGLPPGIAAQLQTELTHYPDVRQVLLFGSRAMGTQRPNSDIDLCLDAPDMSFPTYLQIAGTLDELVLPYSLDLVLKHHIDNPDFLHHIQCVGVVLYQHEGGRGQVSALQV
ncbi:MAG: nucleotidyltransferase domain-containing protein [Pseudomonadales bacterium]